MNPSRTTTLWLGLLACAAVTVGLAAGARAADAPREVHGSADVFVAPEVALAWGVLRGASDADTQAIIRIDADPVTYAFVAVTGVDPFSQARRQLLRPTRLTAGLEFWTPRSRFSDLPRTELRFYPTAVAAGADAPTLVVYYLGIPDTTPEFATEAQLEAYLAGRILNARKAMREGRP